MNALDNSVFFPCSEHVHELSQKWFLVWYWFGGYKFWKVGEFTIMEPVKSEIWMYENIIAHIPTHTIIHHSWRGRTEGNGGISKVPDIVSDLFSLCPILEASEIFWLFLDLWLMFLTLSMWLVDFLWIKMKQSIG